MFIETEMLTTVILVGVVVYLAYRNWVMDQEIENLMNAHNEFVKVTMSNTELIQQALFEIAEAHDDLCDEVEGNAP